MNPSYSISKPCSEDWNKMTTEEQGRHCRVCCKTVVDFSQKNNSEIVDFLKTNATNKICGRFREEQLQPHTQKKISRLKSHISRPFSRYRTFFAALVFVFGGMLFSSCAGNRPGGTELMGDVAYVPDSLHQKNKIDSVKKTAIIDSIGKARTKKIEPVVPEKFLLGDVALIPDTLK
jgi:hypothetical protein